MSVLAGAALCPRAAWARDESAPRRLGRSERVAFAGKNRPPAIYQIREFVDAGGLMPYGLNYCEHYRSAAPYIDRILKGAKPADLPVELPTRFELVINNKAARRLGLEIPALLLATADQVIE